MQQQQTQAHQCSSSTNDATPTVCLVEECCWSVCIEGGSQLLAGCLLDAVGQRELDLGGQELLEGGAGNCDGDIITVDFRVVSVNRAHTGWHDLGVHNVDGSKTSAVATGKLSIHLFHSAAQADVSVFLVHIVCSASGVVLDCDAVVLDDVCIALSDLIHSQDITSGLLHLVNLVHKVPATAIWLEGMSWETPVMAGKGTQGFEKEVFVALRLQPSRNDEGCLESRPPPRSYSPES
jgi:hypothetical protein